ncbi:MAG: hypothetical protein AAF702_22245 [Chloroflexota bacterium]
MMHRAYVCICISLIFISGCSGSAATPEPTPTQPPTLEASVPLPIGSCSLLAALDATDEEAIVQVLNAEGTFVVEQNIDALMALWSDESHIADAKNTSNNEEDDQIWKGKDAIYHRYVRVVFPGAPSAAQPSDLNIQIDGQSALIMATTNIGDEVSPQGDRWELEKEGECWQIRSLTYNLESTE